MATDNQTRLAIIEVCKKMEHLGINQGTAGNVSIKAQDHYLITASGIAYENMTADHVVKMDFEGGYYGEFLPSSEWRMHQDIYRNRAEAGAIVHTHSTYAAALSCLRKDIPSFHYMIAVAGGNSLRCASYASFGTLELSKNMLVAMEGRSACLLANHGLICFGASLGNALKLAVEIESLCKQYFIACQAGVPIVLDDGEMEIILKKFKTYGKQPAELKDGEYRVDESPMKRG